MRVQAKDRASFLTHNHRSYLIDWVCESHAPHSARYSLQEAVRRGLFSNGNYKMPVAKKGGGGQIRTEQICLDEAIRRGLVAGRRVDLEHIDSFFPASSSRRSSLTREGRGQNSSPPAKPTRGIFVNRGGGQQDLYNEREPSNLKSSTRDSSRDILAFSPPADRIAASVQSLTDGSALALAGKPLKRNGRIFSTSIEENSVSGFSAYSRNQRTRQGTFKSTATVDTLDDLMYNKQHQQSNYNKNNKNQIYCNRLTSA